MQTTQHPAELQAAVKKALHSASFARCVGQAVQAAFAEAQPQPQDVVLPAREKTGRPCWGWTGDYATYEKHNADQTHCFSMQCQPYSGKSDLLGKWYGNEIRFDQDGRAWKRSINRSVVDDFGNLVELA